MTTNGYGVFLGVTKMFWTRQRLHSIMNVLNAIELYTLKWLILYYVNFTSIFKKESDQIIHDIQCTVGT